MNADLDKLVSHEFCYLHEDEDILVRNSFGSKLQEYCAENPGNFIDNFAAVIKYGLYHNKPYESSEILDVVERVLNGLGGSKADIYEFIDSINNYRFGSYSGGRESWHGIKSKIYPIGPAVDVIVVTYDYQKLIHIYNKPVPEFYTSDLSWQIEQTSTPLWITNWSCLIGKDTPIRFILREFYNADGKQMWLMNNRNYESTVKRTSVVKVL